MRLMHSEKSSPTLCGRERALVRSVPSPEPIKRERFDGQTNLLLACAALLVSAALSGCGSSIDYTCANNLCTVKQAAAQMQLSAAAYTAGPGATQARFTVTRSGEIDKPISVRFATSDGTGIAGLDYTASAGTLIWPAGDKSPRTVDVLLKNQQTRRAARAFAVTLSSPSEGATLGDRNQAEVTLEGDDVPTGR